MARYEKTFKEGAAIYVGIDMHKNAWHVTILKDGRFSIGYTTLKRRIGGKRAIVAIARKLIIRIRYMLLNQTQYTDLVSCHLSNVG